MAVADENLSARGVPRVAAVPCAVLSAFSSGKQGLAATFVQARHAALVLLWSKATAHCFLSPGRASVRRMAESHLAPLVASLTRSAARVAEARRGELERVLAGQLPFEDARGLFTRAPRLVGKEPAPFTAEERAALPWPVELAADEVLRVVLLARASEQLGEAELGALVDAVYRHGEARERAAVLKALPFLEPPLDTAGAPGPGTTSPAGRFVDIALDACRTHVVPVFEAIACENPYPARHFSADAFRQLVLKAIFVEVRIGRILGLRARIDAELARMARDYAAERAAAGRPIPEDAAWLGSQA